MTLLPYFGTIDLHDDYFEASFTTTKGQDVSLTIDFEGDEPKTTDLQRVASFLDRLEEQAKTIKDQLLTSAFAEEVEEYIDHHRSELADEPQMQSVTSSEQFVDALQLYAIRIYPTLEESFVSIDFTIDANLTQYVLMVNLTPDLSIHDIAMES
ncbi:DUF2004 domain-containing protein [Myroides sp. 1354]|uniref:DUF2004 domain-containing protein n=1 Tax=unclassified Myroides TaxID=2642485 RepID=UPI002576B38A|nr:MULTISPECIES: DUF2004 domain-containing protein [unclassified Myroides]MDM1046035.1 DUF2004 domain-containing protein [Myroides sp. R163-1]MDM1056971.1 DUF2004 domain-containing protein [Myroides sp. 1354]MDM1070166.1 DUF2004 domain-containing protein [Myroides sp. 1372]